MPTATRGGRAAGAAPVFAPLRRTPRRWPLFEKSMELCLVLAALASVGITTGIVYILLGESVRFFSHVSIVEFLTETRWTPTFADAHHGILPLLAGTFTTTAIALIVAMPIGTVVAIWLSEYAPHRVREILKPIIELLGAVPTVVYGYFALLFVTPLLQKLIPSLPVFNMLGPGIVMGIMIVPYVSSLSEDAMRAVPMLLREGSYAMGANRLTTALRVVFPAALSGIGAAYTLAMARAVGETMIVAIAAGQEARLTANPLEPAATVTAFIVQVSQGDLPHGTVPYQSIFAAGLMLFLVTMLFNLVGGMLRRRFRQSY